MTLDGARPGNREEIRLRQPGVRMVVVPVVSDEADWVTEQTIASDGGWSTVG